MAISDLPPFDLDTTQPLQAQIHRQFVQWIKEGRLEPGTRLPSSRQLSLLLAVSRNTVVAVIDQLKAEGFVRTEVGRGSFIEPSLPQVQPIDPVVSSLEFSSLPLSGFAQQLEQLSVSVHQKTMPFTPGIPALEDFPMAVWQRLWRYNQSRIRLMGYDHYQGYMPLRSAIADYLRVSRGVRANADQILITDGAQQALALSALVLLDDGDKVLHENPGYRGAQSAFSIRHTQQVAVPLKHQAIDVDWLIKHEQHCEDAKLLYTTPTHQYPMGGLLSAADRIRLLEWATEKKLWLIEDDYDSEFHFLHSPVAAMQGMTQQNNVIYMGSFSKVLYPSLRLGYLVLPKQLVAPFTQAKSIVSGESTLLQQAVIADFIEEGHFARHLRRMRQSYKKKWLDFEDKINKKLAQQVDVIAESAGMHLVLDFNGRDDKSICRILNQEGFGGSALSAYYLDDAQKTGMVFGFANSNEQQREALVERLADLLGH
ncbi:PLP-dependent aminotransferase family protein [Reinekea thalattae]|uniref:PLP-dependent aminotransferase family protein n=1 Tax=Reinekea thalattae TaxID=2593301 RepID=A0A5C8Z814_9GAMM|nr:PLP-dependent aminotransferase family protein [Reinekea thalattae]TXR53291.1 PLP-dependent aminotransferase family protein [Reinekea thalattae]